MPRVVRCPEIVEGDQEATCPLATPAGFHAKFCPLCGRAASEVVENTKPRCQKCSQELDAEGLARFCPNCGSRVERENVTALLANFQRPTTPPGGSKGRSLSSEEMNRIERSVRTPTRASDPVRGYKIDPEHQDIMGLNLPAGGEDNEAVRLARGRIAERNPEGQFRPGGLSSESKLPTNYHEGVVLIPYKFSTPARAPQQMVGGPAPTGPATPEDQAFFTAPKGGTKGTNKKKGSRKLTLGEALGDAAPRPLPPAPAGPGTCRECGRPLPTDDMGNGVAVPGDCTYCIKFYDENDENDENDNDVG